MIELTHTLHRSGTRDSLRDDFVWQVYPSRGVNDYNVPDRLRKVVDVITDLGSSNWGDVYTGCARKVPVSKIREKLQDGSKLRGVLTSKSQVVRFLRSMKNAEIGFSVIISGLMDEILDACQQTAVTPHTINLSLGIWGKKELLAKQSLLEVTTMCGHHMISPRLVEKTISDVRRRAKSAARASSDLVGLCPCGVFNPERAQRLIQQQAEK